MLRSLFQNWTQLILFPGLLSLTIKWAWNLWSFPPANQTGPITVSIREEAAARPVLLELRLCSWLHGSRVSSCNYIPASLSALPPPRFWDWLSQHRPQKISIFKILSQYQRKHANTIWLFFFSTINSIFSVYVCCKHRLSDGWMLPVWVVFNSI